MNKSIILVLSSCLSIASLSAKDINITTKDINKFVKRIDLKKSPIELNNSKIIEIKHEESLKGWDIVMTSLSLSYKDQSFYAPEIIFVKDGLATNNLYDVNRDINYRNDLKPSVKPNLYDNKHLLYGDKNAKHKILIFADPKGKNTYKDIKPIFDIAKSKPHKFAVYYYHIINRRLHPASKVLTKILYVLQKEDKKELFEKVYTLDIPAKANDAKQIVDYVNKELDLDIKVSQIESKDVQDGVKDDERVASEMLVTGSPSIFIDGKWDKTRDRYKKFLK